VYPESDCMSSCAGTVERFAFWFAPENGILYNPSVKVESGNEFT
jgi:hypothetical protein